MFQGREKGLAAKECAKLFNFIPNIERGKMDCSNGHVAGLLDLVVGQLAYTHRHTQLNQSRVRFGIPEHAVYLLTLNFLSHCQPPQ